MGKCASELPNVGGRIWVLEEVPTKAMFVLILRWCIVSIAWARGHETVGEKPFRKRFGSAKVPKFSDVFSSFGIFMHEDIVLYILRTSRLYFSIIIQRQQ